MKTLDQILKEVKAQEKKTLIRKLLVFYSPVTKDLEYRVSYFISNAEASIWEDEMNLKYKKLDIPYGIYTFMLGGVNPLGSREFYMT